MPLRRGRGDITTPARPTPGQPITSFPTPVIADVIVREDVQLGRGYRALAYGTPHPLNDQTGLDLRLVWQGPASGDNARKTVQRIYATPRTAQDVYNYALKFDEESTAHPIFIRTYVELRSTYAPLTKGSKFTGVVSAKVTNGGANYDPDHPPTVVVSGGGGSGAVLRAVVYGKSVAYLQILNEGTGYTSTPTLSFTDTSGGSGAAATTAIQPSGAILTNEEVQRIENEDPKLASLFVRVHRVYKVLPGPLTTNRRIGQDNLTPRKYMRLVRTVETGQTVNLNDYVFPSGLVGDQTSIELQEQTVIEARLKIISEIIAIGAEPLLGGETNEYGPLAIYESVVNEGTAIDAGFLILKSSVTPFGNGKAVKITVKYPLDLALRKLLEQSIGRDNLTPAKYRRLLKRKVTNTLVDPAIYTFPNFLAGDETEIKYLEESIYRARLAVIEEIIAIGSDPMLGAEGDEYGALAIYETVVNEGTPIDQGFVIKHSRVEPFGNGKAVKITVVYTNLTVASLKLVGGGSGYSNGVHTDGTFTGGGGSGATFKYTVAGGVVQAGTLIVTNPGSGYTDVPTAVVGAGSATATAYLGSPLLSSRLYDDEMQVHYDESRQIVMVGTPDSANEDYVSEETKALDIWRSARVRTKKIPTAVDASTAIVSYTFQPYKFPGTLDALLATVSDGFLGYRSAKADLVRHKIKTWWQLSNTAPAPAFDEIVTDTISIQGIDRVERFSDVLHDAVLTHINNTGASQFYAATSPSFSQYYAGTPSGTSTPHNIISLFNPGAGGYSVGDVLNIGSAQIQITAVQGGGYIWSWIILDEGIGGTYSNPVTATGGSGSGAQFNVTRYETANYVPGTAWVGTERVIAASVTPEPQIHLWKIQTHTVVMR